MAGTLGTGTLGSGTLGTPSAPVSFSDVSTVTGGGGVATAGRKGAASSSAVTGGGTVANVGRKGGLGASAITGGGAVTNLGRKGGRSASAASAGGSVANVGLKGGRSASAVTGGGSVTNVGRRSALSASAVTGGGAVTNIGRKGARGASAATGGGSVTNLGRKGGLGAIGYSNEIPNWSAEWGLGNWDGWDGGASAFKRPTVITTDAYDGSQSLEVASASLPANQFISIIPTRYEPDPLSRLWLVTPGQTLDVSFAGKVVAAPAGNYILAIQVGYLRADGTLIGRPNVTGNPGTGQMQNATVGQWYRLYGQSIVPAGAAYAYPQMMLFSQTTGAYTLRADAAVMKTGTLGGSVTNLGRKGGRSTSTATGGGVCTNVGRKGGRSTSQLTGGGLVTNGVGRKGARGVSTVTVGGSIVTLGHRRLTPVGDVPTTLRLASRATGLVIAMPDTALELGGPTASNTLADQSSKLVLDDGPDAKLELADGNTELTVNDTEGRLTLNG